MAKMPLGYSSDKLLGMLEGAKRKSRQPGVYNIDRDQVMSFGLSPQSVGKEIVKHHPEMGVQVLGEDLKVVDSRINPGEHSKILQHPQNNISPGVSFYPRGEGKPGGIRPDRHSGMYRASPLQSSDVNDLNVGSDGQRVSKRLPPTGSMVASSDLSVLPYVSLSSRKDKNHPQRSSDNHIQKAKTLKIPKWLKPIVFALSYLVPDIIGIAATGADPKAANGLVAGIVKTRLTELEMKYSNEEITEAEYKKRKAELEKMLKGCGRFANRD